MQQTLRIKSGNMPAVITPTSGLNVTLNTITYSAVYPIESADMTTC